MKIKTTFNNILPKEFGKEAKREDIMQGNPVRSFAFEVDNLPKVLNISLLLLLIMMPFLFALFLGFIGALLI